METLYYITNINLASKNILDSVLHNRTFTYPIVYQTLILFLEEVIMKNLY